MSEYIVTSPTGQKFKVNAPEGATQAQVLEYAQSQFKRKSVPREVVKPDPIPFAARAGRGAMDFIDRLTQLTIAGMEKTGFVSEGTGDRATQAMHEDQLRYEADRQAAADGNAGFDGARLLGNIGMQSPLALLPGGKGFLGRMKAGAIQGGMSGALQFDPSNSLMGSLRNTALGAGTGAVVSPVAGYLGDKLAQGIRYSLGRLRGLRTSQDLQTVAQQVIDEVPTDQLSLESKATLLSEAQEQISRTGSLDADALARKANLLANDVTPTKSMVTRNPADWSRERNLQKLGQSQDDNLAALGRRLTDIYSANDRALANRLDFIGRDLPRGRTQEAYGAAVMESIGDLADTSQKEVGRLYNEVEQKFGSQLASDAKQLKSVLEELRDNAYSEKLVTSVSNRLKRFGMLDNEGNLTANTLTVKQAEELRKFVNTLPNDFGKRQIVNAIDQDVLGGFGDDAFKAARSAAAGRKGMLENPATQKALSALGELSEGKTAQNFIRTQVVNAADRDVNTLMATIEKMEAGPRNEALGALRAGVMSYLRDKAINESSGKFSGSAFNKALGEVGAPKLQQIFGTQMARELRSLGKAALDSTYEPAYSAVNTSNTAPALLTLMRGGRGLVGLDVPFINEVTEQALARSAYGKQLSQVLAAPPTSPLPPLNPRASEMLGLLGPSLTPAANAALDQKRKKTNANR